MLNNMPSAVHPMSQLSCAITALNYGSKFSKAYASGVSFFGFFLPLDCTDKNLEYKSRQNLCKMAE